MRQIFSSLKSRRARTFRSFRSTALGEKKLHVSTKLDTRSLSENPTKLFGSLKSPIPSSQHEEHLGTDILHDGLSNVKIGNHSNKFSPHTTKDKTALSSDSRNSVGDRSELSSTWIDRSNEATFENYRQKIKESYEQLPGTRNTKPDLSKDSIKYLEKSLQEQLLARPEITIYDHMAPTPSHLLKISLKSFLPFIKSCLDMELTNKGKFCLPPGHHLVYFHPQVATSHLLPDGTDDLHYPGLPFERRLWVGGSIDFARPITLFPKIQMLCSEKITGVRVNGILGNEKVFVDITRLIINPFLDRLELKEVRTLVFMRRKNPGEIVDRENSQKPKMKPYYSIIVRPNRALLFRFSALTFNAHRIHLDSNYCRQVEGLKSTVVHGPLTVVLMLSVLTEQLWERARLKNFTYRNIAPLYVEEDMKICVKKGEKSEGIATWHVWIEGPSGGYAVKGTAYISWVGNKDKSEENQGGVHGIPDDEKAEVPHHF